MHKGLGRQKRGCRSSGPELHSCCWRSGPRFGLRRRVPAEPRSPRPPRPPRMLLPGRRSSRRGRRAGSPASRRPLRNWLSFRTQGPASWGAGSAAGMAPGRRLAPRTPARLGLEHFPLPLVSRVPLSGRVPARSHPPVPRSHDRSSLGGPASPSVLCLSPRAVSPSPTLSCRPHLFGVGRDPFSPASWRRGLIQTDPLRNLFGSGRGTVPVGLSKVIPGSVSPPGREWLLVTPSSSCTRAEGSLWGPFLQEEAWREPGWGPFGY